MRVSIYKKIVTYFAAIIDTVTYYIKFKYRRIVLLEKEVEELYSEKEADLLEIRIRGIMEDEKLLKKELDHMGIIMLKLEEKRVELAEKIPKMNTKELEYFWENY